MTKTQIPLYATFEDWKNLVMSISSKRPLVLARAGTFDTPAVEVLGANGELDAFASYLVLDSPNTVSTRQVPQRNGDVRHAVDQLDNAGSIVLQIGGVTVNRERLVAGQVGTVSTEQSSQELYALFVKEIKKQFIKIKSYYVGPGASHLLGAGMRLTPTGKSPREYDLVR